MGVRVSVIMAAYNCESMIEDSINSILQQTYTDWELIVCDDGSSDSTYQILCDYQRNNPEKIIVIQNEKNSKLPFSLNQCLKHARGEYVARMDADDKSYPERIKKQVDYLDTHPEIDVVGTGMTCFDGNNITGERHPMQEPGPTIIGLGVPFFHATIMMRRSVYMALGGYSLKPYVIRCEDVDLWIRFFGEGYKGANLQEPLYFVREDINASRRRNIKGGINASKTLFNGFRKYHYPVRQYLYVIKPIISTIIPSRWKYYVNRNRWNTLSENSSGD